MLKHTKRILCFYFPLAWFPLTVLSILGVLLIPWKWATEWMPDARHEEWISVPLGVQLEIENLLKQNPDWTLPPAPWGSPDYPPAYAFTGGDAKRNPDLFQPADFQAEVEKLWVERDQEYERIESSFESREKIASVIRRWLRSICYEPVYGFDIGAGYRRDVKVFIYAQSLFLLLTLWRLVRVWVSRFRLRKLGFDWVSPWGHFLLLAYMGKGSCNLPSPDQILMIPGYGPSTRSIINFVSDWEAHRKTCLAQRM